MAFEKKLLKGNDIDATPLEANAATKSIERRDGGGTWKAYLMKIAKDAAGRSTAAVRPQEKEQEDEQRRMGFAERSRRSHDEENGHNDRPRLQG